jgi:cell pole-organizing protein PopZ
VANGNSSNDGASVEEILESIKRVMERDRKAAPAMPLPPKAETVESPKAEKPLASSAENKETEEVLDLSEMELSDVVETEDVTPKHDDADDTDLPLITERVRGEMQENLAALAMLAEPGARPRIVRSGETSLEGLTRELLRPMLADWLDKNLPGMVEKMVQAEIARIAGKRG